MQLNISSNKITTNNCYNQPTCIKPKRRVSKSNTGSRSGWNTQARIPKGNSVLLTAYALPEYLSMYPSCIKERIAYTEKSKSTVSIKESRKQHSLCLVITLYLPRYLLIVIRSSHCAVLNKIRILMKNFNMSEKNAFSEKNHWSESITKKMLPHIFI